MANQVTSLLLVSLVFLLASLTSARTAERNSTRRRLKRSVSCDDPLKKIDCGYYGITGESCQSLGCCYNPNVSSGPHCYIGSGGLFTTQQTCDFSKPHERTDCGWSGITKSQCEANGCCYDSRVSGVNNCFQPASATVEPESESEIITRSDIEELIFAEKEAVRAFAVLKSRILKAQRDYSIAKTVGAGASSAGTIAMVAGYFLMPFTAGGSLALVIGGMTTTALGAGTALTASILETVDTGEWADELVDVLAEREIILQKIGYKIVNHPGWQAKLKLAAKGVAFVAFKGPWVTTVAYLGIMAPQYGIQSFAGLCAASVCSIPGISLMDETALLTRVLAKIGVDTTRIGWQSMKLLTPILGVAGIGLDIYTIVDTWTSEPQAIKDIDKITAHLEESTLKLDQLLRTNYQ